MSGLPISIDHISPSSSRVLDPSIPLLPIEWFESQKSFFLRDASNGNSIKLEKNFKGHWQNGDLLYSGDQLIAQIAIQPCLTICFSGYSPRELVDFSYYIGNRHLPLFTNAAKDCLLVGYDGNLFEQLQNKFADKITLVQEVLHPHALLQKQLK